MDVSAIIVTRGNVDLLPVLQSLPPRWERIVWDNSPITPYAPSYVWEGAPPWEFVQCVGPRAHGTPDLGVYGRYAAIEYAKHDVIFVQDDDVVLAPESFDALLEAYEPGYVTANMTEYHQLHTHDSALIGFGAVFDRNLPALAFRKFWRPIPPSDLPWDYGWRPHPHDAQATGLFLRTCDVVFTALTPRRVIDTPYTYLPWASDDNRMSRQGGFAVERQEVLDQLKELV